MKQFVLEVSQQVINAYDSLPWVKNFNALDTIAMQRGFGYHAIPIGFLLAYYLMLRYFPAIQKKKRWLCQKTGRSDPKTGEPWWDLTPFATRCMFCWNLLLSAYSLFASFFMLAEFLVVVLGGRGGVVETMCPSDCHHLVKAHGWICYSYVISKYVELMDTVWLLLKRPERTPMFLHRWHHAMTFFWCWYSFGYGFSGFGDLAMLNCGVHVPMYLYYALVIYNKQSWGIVVTSLQIIQMVGNVTLGYAFCVIVLKETSGGNGNGCCSANSMWSAILVGITTTIGVSYLGLFIHLFAGKYCTKKKKKSE